MANSNIVNFGSIAPQIIVSDNDKGYASLASVMADLMYVQVDLATVPRFKSTTDEAYASSVAAQAIKNEASAAKKAEFLAKFEPLMGYVKPSVLVGDSSKFFKSGDASLTQLGNIVEINKITNKGEEQVSKIKVDVKKEEDYNIIEIENYMSPVGIWFSVLAYATKDFTSEHMVDFLMCAFDKCKAEGDVINKDMVSIDFGKGSVTTPTRTLEVNKYTCFGEVGEEYLILSGRHSLFMLGLQLLGDSSNKVYERINNAVPMFKEEHNYGLVPEKDEITHIAYDNIMYTAALKGRYARGRGGINNLMTFDIIGGKQSTKLLSYLCSKGVLAAPDKQNTKYMVLEAGARALGLGKKKKNKKTVIQSINDLGKLAKVINRAASNKYSCANQPDRVRSNMGIDCRDGVVGHTYGSKRKVLWTNSLLTFGSGVAVIKKGKRFTYSISKREKEMIPFTAFGVIKVTERTKISCKDVVDNKIKEVVGKTFYAGETILDVTDYKTNVVIPLVKNGEKVAKVKVVGGQAIIDDTMLKINLDVELIEVSSWVKTRRVGTKFTTLPYDVYVEGVGEWDIMMNVECTKGNGALIEAFLNANGYGIVDSSEGTITMENGRVIDLADKESEIYKWVRDNTKERVIKMWVAKSVWDSISPMILDPKITVVDEKDNKYLVKEIAEVLECELVFDVEIASSVESVSTSNLTLESAAAVCIQNQRVGELLLAECVSKSKQYSSLVQAFSYNDKADQCVVDFFSEPLEDESFDDYVLLVHRVTGEDKDKLFGMSEDEVNKFAKKWWKDNAAKETQRWFMQKMAKAYPCGMRIVKKDDFLLSINPGLVCALGSFNALNGSAIRETGKIYNFFVDLFLKKGSNILDKEQGAVRVEYSYRYIIETQAMSKNVMKKPTRSGDVVYTKVRTSFHPLLHSEDGIPIMVLHEKSKVGRLLKAKDGDLIAGFRTPMPFCGVFRLRLTNDYSITDKVHAVICPFVWHALTEGDADGDGIALMNLSAYHLTIEEAVEMNNHKLGMRGYTAMYGTKLPYADFVSAKDKYGKKSLLANEWTLINNTCVEPTIIVGKTENVDLTEDLYGNIGELVGRHYQGKVGTAYGLCSNLIFQALEALYVGEKDNLDVLIDANLYAWRFFYEGQGLSGYSALAGFLFSIIEKGALDVKENMVLYYEDTHTVKCVYDKEVSKEDKKKYSAQSELVLAKYMGLEDVNTDALLKLIDARSITMTGQKMEKQREMSKYWNVCIVDALRYSSLRRLSQGNDYIEGGVVDAEEEISMIESGDTVKRPLIIEAYNQNVSYSSPLGNVMDALGEVYTHLHSGKQNRLASEKLKGAG